jgi:hypothetical protein
MNRLRSAFVFVLALTAGVTAAPLATGDRAQQPTPPADSPRIIAPQAPAPPATPVGTRNVQVEVTVKLEGPGTPITKQMTLVGANDLVSMGRAGMDVPVVQTGMPAQYRSVGINVDARPRLVDGGRIGLMLKLEFSAILKPEGGSGTPGTPSFGSSKTELNLVLDSGKPLVVAHAADAEVGRGYTVEIKATLLK